MSDKPWKATERRIAKVGGGKRTGATGKATDDVTWEVLPVSIECKHGRAVPKFLLDAMEQARKNCREGCVPVAAFHKTRTHRYYAVLTVAQLAELVPEMLLCVEVGELARLGEREEVAE